MALPVRNLQQIPEGKHAGIIVSAGITEKIFDHAKGPESTLEIVIQPKAPNKDVVYGQLSCVFTPEVNPLSGLGKLLLRLRKMKNEDFKSLKEFDESTIVGTEVSFNVILEKGNQFPRAVKDSITAL